MNANGHKNSLLFNQLYCPLKLRQCVDYIGSLTYIQPDICFQKLKHEGSNEPVSIANYLLEIFDATLPRYRLTYRLKKYVEFFDEDIGTWDTETYGEKPPTILLVCATLRDLIYAKRKTRGLLATIWDYDDEDRPHIQFTTTEKLKELGVKGKIWEEA